MYISRDKALRDYIVHEEPVGYGDPYQLIPRIYKKIVYLLHP